MAYEKRSFLNHYIYNNNNIVVIVLSFAIKPCVISKTYVVSIGGPNVSGNFVHRKRKPHSVV